MLQVLAHLDYRRLFTAQVVALLGTGLATIALALLAYDLAPDRAGQIVATALSIKMAAYVLVAPLASAALAGLPSKQVLIGASLIRGLVACCLPFVTEIWQIYLLVFILQSASASYTPAFQALIPRVLPDQDDYINALSLSRLAGDLEQVASPILAATLLLVVNDTQLFFGTAAGFLAGALLVASVPLNLNQKTVENTSFGERLGRGVKLFFTKDRLRPVLALNFVVAITLAFILVQTVVVAQRVFGLDESSVTWLLAANGLGSMMAALMIPRLLIDHTERSVLLTAATGLALLTMLIPIGLLLGGGSGFMLTMLLWWAMGFAWSAVETPIGRVIRKAVGDQELSAAFAAQFSLSHACWLVGYSLVGWLGQNQLVITPLLLGALALLGAALARILWPARQAVENVTE